MPRPPLYTLKISQWVEYLESANYSLDTIRLYSTSANIAWEYGIQHGWPNDPRKVEVKQLRNYIQYLRRYSSGTQYVYSVALLLFLKWNGNRHIEDFRLKMRPTRTNVDWLTVEETSAVILSAPNLWTRTMEIMFAYTGIRRSELVYLRTADVQREHITVVGKGSRARKIPITEHFWESMGPYLRWRRTVQSPLFLCHAENAGNPAGPYATGGISTAIRTHSNMIGRHISPHTFRRSYGRHLYKAGMPLQEIQRLYGHQEVSTTIRYLGINDEDLSASVTKYQPKY